jgi:hypothetical protein
MKNILQRSRKFFNVLFIVFNAFVFRLPHLYTKTDMKNVFQNKLYKILNEELNKKMFPFMIRPEGERLKFNFKCFGREGYTPEKILKDSNLETPAFSKYKDFWFDFWIKVAKFLSHIVGLELVIKIDESVIKQNVEEILEQRDKLDQKDSQGVFSQDKSQENELQEVVAPLYFKRGRRNIISVIAKISAKCEPKNINDSCAFNINDSELFINNSCRFDSVMSILYFLYEYYFSFDDIKELELCLPSFSILFKFLKDGKFSYKTARSIWYHILCKGNQKDEHGSIHDVYRSLKRLMMGSTKDPPIVSLFSTPYFCSPGRKCQNVDCETNSMSKKMVKKNIEKNIEKVCHWGYGTNPILSMYINNFNNYQDYCSKGCGALSYFSVIDNFPKYCSIFCSREKANDISNVIEVTYLSMTYKLISVAYSNQIVTEKKGSDHFLSIVRSKENKYFVCDGQVNDGKPEILNNTTFPSVFLDEYYPVLLVYERETSFNEAGIYKEGSTSIVIEKIMQDDNRNCISICISESVETKHVPDKFDLAKYFIANFRDNITQVCFSSPMIEDGVIDWKDSHIKRTLSIFYSLMQIFFHIKVLAVIILSYNAEFKYDDIDVELLQLMRKILLYLRYPQLSYDPSEVASLLLRKINNVKYNEFVHQIAITPLNMLKSVPKMISCQSNCCETMALYLTENYFFLNCTNMYTITLCENCEREIGPINTKSLILSISNTTAVNIIYPSNITMMTHVLELSGFVLKNNNDTYDAYFKDWDDDWYCCKYREEIVRVDNIPERLEDVAYMIYFKRNSIYEEEKAAEHSFKKAIVANSHNNKIYMSDVLPSFIDYPLYIYRYCIHESVSKSEARHAEIMPSKYAEIFKKMETCKPFTKYFCTVKDCKIDNHLDIEELTDDDVEEKKHKRLKKSTSEAKTNQKIEYKKIKMKRNIEPSTDTIAMQKTKKKMKKTLEIIREAHTVRSFSDKNNTERDGGIEKNTCDNNCI